MKAITIKQPWAYLICSGIKDIENRTWKTNRRGRVLIHAGSGNKFKVELTDDQMNAAFGSCYQRAQIGGYNFGAIIGGVEIVDCVVNHPSIWAEKTIIEQMECPKCGCDRSEYFGDGEHKCDRCEHTWYENENKLIYNWILANPVLFPEPIPCKGKLSFWEYPRIPSPELDDFGHKVCMCNIPVEEKSQVIHMIDHFECRYCGGRWYK